jgi:hypothetical protein
MYTKKASFMWSFIERNFHKCPQIVKENLFNTLVRPLLEYGYVWNLYSGLTKALNKFSLTF